MRDVTLRGKGGLLGGMFMIDWLPDLDVGIFLGREMRKMCS